MRKLSVLLLAIVLSSCASMQYGNFTVASQSKDIYLAKDATSQLIRIYPPAQNTFYISQKVNDGFGINLTHEMRNKGYGVIENVQPRQKANFSMWLMRLSKALTIESVFILARKH